MIDVLVVDDQQLIRKAVAELVEHEPDMRLAGTAENGVEAVRQAKRLEPDVVVMDVRMPVMDGIEATRIITRDAALPGMRVLILTTFEDEPEYVVHGVRSGAAGFVGKGAEPDVIVEAIRTVHRGEGLLTPRATKNLLDRYAGSATPSQLHPELRSLTPRELDILGLVAEGKTNQAIADKLGISVVTVKTHINRTMTKLGRHDRAQLVVLAFETGLVTPRYR
ncbi:response regulator [Nocardioides sp. SYSU DS0663]|uniref:response regulator n=1 Tax=Nocardioides sp. SYSU DS0663 TaxID=3416445 RepID=UPI003F4BE77C